MPLISIITVCFNSENYLRETLESVAAQNFPDYEHIVWDGNSTDSTPAILDAFESNRLRRLRGIDGGIYEAMTKASGHAKGKYLIFLNSDDILTSPDALSAISSACNGYPDLVCWDISYFGGSGRVVRGTWRSSRSYPAAAKLGIVPPHPGTAVRRDTFMCLGGFSSEYRIAGDFDFFLRLSKLNPSVAFIPNTLIRMRMGGESTRSLRQAMRGLCESIRSTNRAFGVWALFAMFKPFHKVGQFSVKHAGR